MEIIVMDVIADAGMGMGIGHWSVRNDVLCELGWKFIVTSVNEVHK